MADRTYDLFREYPTKPFQRFACCVTEDENAEYGFRVVEHDHKVADPDFFHKLSVRLSQPAVTMRAVPARGMHFDGLATLMPGDDGYFDVAIRSVPGATLRRRA